MNIKKEINKDELKELYLIDNLSLKKISKIYGVSPNTVKKRIVENNLEKTKNPKVEISKEELYDLYIKQNLLQKEIAIMKKISLRQLQKMLYKYKIKKPKDLFYSQIKQIVKDRYGVENVSQIKEVREKVKETISEKYGVDNISKNEEIKKMKKQKALEKYGVECVLSNNEIKEKIKKTNLKRYGFENVNQSPIIREKSKETNLKKYGTEYVSQSEIVKNKIKETNLKIYGVPYASQNEKVKMKIAKTNMERYGCSSSFGSPIFKEEIKKTCLSKYGVPYACMTEKCRRANGNATSKINQNFSKKLRDNNIKNKLEKPINKYSYDIEILNKNILIELNPTYTHNTTYGSEFRGHKKKPLEKEYHFNKTLNAINNGYRCIHIWDWDNKDKIINLLKNKRKIYARNCSYRKISEEECRAFLEKNHLQGNCRGQKVMIGLFFDNKLVEVMTFGKPRYNKNYEWELLRLCSDFEYTIIGGASRLFKHFLIDYSPNSIISYCDNSKFDGNIYKSLGFIQDNYGKPSRHWYNQKTKQHITDNLLRQRGYDQLFKTNFGKGTSNENLMIESGFVEIYDCGQSTYIWQKNKKAFL